MSDEQKQETEQPAKNNDTGNQPETASLIDRADNVAKRMEEANKKAEELLIRQERIATRLMLGGRSDAGAVQKTPEQARKDEIETEVSKILKKFR